MKSQTLAGFERYGKTISRAVFLGQMDQAVPWLDLRAPIDPVYPKAGLQGGRPPTGLEQMLRIYFLQAWLNLSDPGVDDAQYDSATMRSFVGIDLSDEPASVAGDLYAGQRLRGATFVGTALNGTKSRKLNAMSSPLPA